MRNSVSDNDMFIRNDEEDEEDAILEDGKNDSDSDTDSSSSSSPKHSSRQNSYTTSWPQSYRQSIDMYTAATPPNITPALNRLSSSFLSSPFASSFLHKATPEQSTPLLTKPTLPTSITPYHKPHEDEKQQQLHPRKPSLPKIQEVASKVSHDPHSMKKGCSYGQAVLNGMNVLCGVGILSTPYAVKEGGWIGLSILFLFAVLAWYTGILLRDCLISNNDNKNGKILATYPDIGEAAFGTLGRIAISIILYLELYALCVEFIILESDNLSSLFPNADLDLGGLHLSSHTLFAIVSMLIVLPSTWLRDLSILSYISVLGVLASILVALSLMWVGLVDQVGFHNQGTSLNLSGVPIAIGVYGFCYSGHAVFPNIYSSLKEPSQYSSVLLCSFAICTVIFAGVAGIGYIMFGENTSSQFTLNMPQDLVATKVAIWTTVVNPITKYALTLTPLAMSLEELIPSDYRSFQYTLSIVIRTILVFSTLLVALTVPFFGLVMALIGSLLTMLVTLILPCACYLSIYRGKVPWYKVLFCVFIIAVGAISAVFGTYSSLAEIIKKY